MKHINVFPISQTWYQIFPLLEHRLLCLFLWILGNEYVRETIWSMQLVEIVFSILGAM